MSQESRAMEINEAIIDAKAALVALKEKGAGIPAVEKNVLRLLGTLKALEAQFGPLDAILRCAGDCETKDQGGSK